MARDPDSVISSHHICSGEVELGCCARYEHCGAVRLTLFYDQLLNIVSRILILHCSPMLYILMSYTVRTKLSTANFTVGKVQVTLPFIPLNQQNGKLHHPYHRNNPCFPNIPCSCLKAKAWTARSFLSHHPTSWSCTADHKFTPRECTSIVP
jgi:hypothetical protein